MPSLSAPKEATIVAAIMRYLKTLPNCRAEKTHGGAYGNAGKPDITGCIQGRRFEIEVKRPGGVVSKIQQKTLAEWREAGAIAGVAYSVDDVKKLLSDYA